MKFVNYTVVQLSLCIGAGILFTAHYNFVSFPLHYLLPLCFIVLVLLWHIEKKRLHKSILFSIIAYLTFFCVGASVYQATLPPLQSKHYTHQKNFQDHNLLTIKLMEELKPNGYYYKYKVAILQIDKKEVSGKLLLSIQKDSLEQSFTIDDVLHLYTNIQEVPAALNPNPFDYKKYLTHQEIYHQLRVSKEDILSVSEGQKSLKGFSESVRNHIIEKLSHTTIEARERSIIQALLLGQRKDIDRGLYEEYVAAGAIHILAVSGLHVGILFLMLGWLLQPLTWFRYGTLLRMALILLFLWAFAILAGLSPSVVRAVTMFSFFALADTLERRTNSFNTLFLSFFVLLLLKPHWLFHVGFQLSYLAVFFILWIQPSLYKLYTPQYKLDKMLWGITTVTVAAQIGVAPLSIYYFHQFPGLFFVTNLVVLPILGTLLIAGIVVLILSVYDILPVWLGELYNYSIQFLNRFISWVATHESFIFKDISISLLQLIFGYIAIVFCILFLKKPNSKQLMLVLTSISLFTIAIPIKQYCTTKEQFIVFHKSRTSLLGYQHNRALVVFKSDSSLTRHSFPLKGYMQQENIKALKTKSLPNIFRYRNNLVLRLDSLGVYPAHNFDIVLLTESPKVHLHRLIDSVKPSLIIADGSNYSSYVMRWENTCKEMNIPFHNTRKNGAYILK